MVNPAIADGRREALVKELMAARRAVFAARRAGDADAEGAAKRALGERGPV